ncbi:hypothetical protein P171DRAFT_232697 [Karstenula rhodostoma CBS 690.94]|uniref:Uncharacterized protein n=1 Tax=Karstenula rhodostoma CBS 690.94 TaxID=1392251 RepID=A0A9P4PRA5_9PLEO|nr:hypothetical protein P171DRAFT_232697 [Karstenula rhodostoma CBS 690.94]
MRWWQRTCGEHVGTQNGSPGRAQRGLVAAGLRQSVPLQLRRECLMQLAMRQGWQQFGREGATLCAISADAWLRTAARRATLAAGCCVQCWAAARGLRHGVASQWSGARGGWGWGFISPAASVRRIEPAKKTRRRRRAERARGRRTAEGEAEQRRQRGRGRGRGKVRPAEAV